MKRMGYFFVGSLTALALAVTGLSAQASAELKIGIVDMQKALQTVEEGRKAKAQLEKEFNAKKEKLQAEEGALKKLHEEIRNQSLVLNESASKKKQAEFQERVMKLQEMTARSQQEIQAKEQQLTEPLVRRLKVIIGDVAKKKGYSFVLEKNENTVLFHQENDDFTDEVVSIFNKSPKG